MKTNPFVTLVLVILFAAAGFFGGMKYQQSKITGIRSNGFIGPPAGNGQNFQRMGNGQFRGRSGQIIGTIISSDDKSVTVQLADGSSKIILFGSNTSINKPTEATKADLTQGQRIAVFGSANNDGSVTAQNIQLNPIIRTPSGTPSAAPQQKN
ncbi:MAG TPA: hypothetical protein VF828_02135 [Patescibacteria group bacterium]